MEWTRLRIAFVQMIMMSLRGKENLKFFRRLERIETYLIERFNRET